MQPKNNISTRSKKVLLDTSAIIALLKKEPGYETLEEVIANSSISIINLSELVSVLTRSGIAENEIDEIIKDIIPEVTPFNEDIAINTGKLIKQTKDFGLSFGDRACIATGIYYNMPVYTTDKVWKDLRTLAKVIVVR